MSILPDWLTGYDAENAERAAAADIQLRAMNLRDYQTPGGKYYSAANAAAVTKNYQLQDYSTPFGVERQREQIDQVFTDTLAAQADSIIGKPLGIAWATIKGVLGAIPWWVWIGAALGIFFWLGGFAWLTKRGRGYLAK